WVREKLLACTCHYSLCPSGNAHCVAFVDVTLGPVLSMRRWELFPGAEFKRHDLGVFNRLSIVIFADRMHAVAKAKIQGTGGRVRGPDFQVYTHHAGSTQASVGLLQ